MTTNPRELTVPTGLDTSTPPWRDRGRTALERAAALLAELTLEEKVAQLGSVWLTSSAADFAPAIDGGVDDLRPTVDELAVSDGLGQVTRPYGTAPVSVPEGAARLRRLQQTVIASSRFGIPAIAHEECLTGFAAYGATAFPTPLAWAASFDDALVTTMAAAIGHDMAAVGIHQGLAPVLDVVRDYRWGRVEETLGEDPYLVGQLAAAYVSGLESAGIISTLKHFAGYSASRGARNHGPVSMGPREFADVILTPFETALRLGGARSVMNAYTDLDGVPAAASHELLTTLLRDRWGFEGTVVADYWAVPFLATMHRIAPDAATAGALALAAGLDVELPETRGYGSTLVDLVRSGEVDEALVDRSVLRHLVHKVEAGLLDGTDPVPADAANVDLDSAANRALARRLAEESIVLLANDAGLLPLRSAQRVAVIGPGADEARSLLGCYAFPNHVLATYPGHDLGIEVPTVLAALRDELVGAAISHERGCDFAELDAADIPTAVVAATAADVAVLLVGDVAGLFGKGTSGEGCDALDLRLPGVQHELVKAVLATGTPTVLVVLSGRPYALGDYTAAGAIVQAFFPGAEGGAAIAGVLSGRIATSGRLPVQVPRHPSMTGTYLQPPLGLQSGGISVLDPTPMFPFGHGLTPGVIEYRSLTTSASRVSVDGSVEVSITVANIGDRDAVEVVQLYQSDTLAQVVRPSVQLVGYARVALPAHSSKVVTFAIHTDLLSFTGLAGQRIVEPGEVVFSSGSSAGELTVSHVVELVGTTRTAGHDRVLRAEWSVIAAD